MESTPKYYEKYEEKSIVSLKNLLINSRQYHYDTLVLCYRVIIHVHICMCNCI